MPVEVGQPLSSARMEITQAQRDVREAILGGFAGHLVSAVLWFRSAAACSWKSFFVGELILVLGGVLVFPLTQIVLRATGHAYALPRGHPMNDVCSRCSGPKVERQ
jgi:hypothetical protein